MVRFQHRKFGSAFESQQVLEGLAVEESHIVSSIFYSLCAGTPANDKLRKGR